MTDEVRLVRSTPVTTNVERRSSSEIKWRLINKMISELLSRSSASKISTFMRSGFFLSLNNFHRSSISCLCLKFVKTSRKKHYSVTELVTYFILIRESLLDTMSISSSSTSLPKTV